MEPSTRRTFLSRSSLLAAAPGLVAAALLFGCAGPSPRRPGPPGPESLQPTLAATTEYFGAALSAEATVTAFRHQFAPPKHEGSDHGPSPERHGPPPGGGGGRGGAMGGPPPGGGRDFGGSSEGTDSPPRGGGFAALPRQTLRVSFTNRSGESITFTITALDSAIGNFVPEPSSLTLAPGASGSLLPVSGDAGGILTGLEVAVALRRGTETEKRVFHLVPTGESPAPPPHTLP